MYQEYKKWGLAKTSDHFLQTTGPNWTIKSAFCCYWSALACQVSGLYDRDGEKVIQGQLKKTLKHEVKFLNNLSFFMISANFGECCFVSKHTKHHSLQGEVGIFFPPHREGFPWPSRSKWTRITPTNTPATLFHVVLRQFRRFWASILARKMGYRTVFC